jgi:GntR family transcriptional regulator
MDQDARPQAAAHSTPIDFGIDHDSPLPRYLQIRDQLRRGISEGRVEAKHLSDSWLMKQFKVSRMTVRQALDLLRHEGLVSREQGKGTRVTDPVEGQLLKPERFFEDWEAQGKQVTARIIEQATRRADAHTAKVLGVRRGASVGFFRRLRYVDGQPICIDERFLRVDLLRQLSEDDLLSTPDLVLQARLKIILARADIRILATAAEEKEAALLGVSVGAPLLERVMELYAADGRGVICGPSYFRSDRYVYRLSVTP